MNCLIIDEFLNYKSIFYKINLKKKVNFLTKTLNKFLFIHIHKSLILPLVKKLNSNYPCIISK